MPRKSRRPAINYKKQSRKKSSSPNVYVPPEEEEAAAENGARRDAAGAETGQQPAAGREERRRRRAQSRVGRGSRARNAPLRSTVYAEFLPQELRKLAVISAGLAVALVALTFTLN